MLANMLDDDFGRAAKPSKILASHTIVRQDVSAQTKQSSNYWSNKERKSHGAPNAPILLYKKVRLTGWNV